MDCTRVQARPLVYALIGIGCLLALATALDPQPTGAWHLEAGFLVCGLIPYVVYGSLTDILSGPVLLAGSVALLASDLVARFGLAITAAAQDTVTPAIGLCVLLVLVVLPAGAGLGKVLARLCS